jgi:hypothetical protein
LSAVEDLIVNVERLEIRQFEIIRADLSHFVLRNGILARLGITSDILAATGPKRAEQMTKRILEINAVSANHQAALRAWHGGFGYSIGVRRSVAQLLTTVANFHSIRRTMQFPAKEVVTGWLDQMESFLMCLKLFPDLSPAEQESTANNFATGTNNLLEFLGYLDPDSKEFRMYFERT